MNEQGGPDTGEDSGAERDIPGSPRSGANDDASGRRRGRRPKLDDTAHRASVEAVAAGLSLEDAAAAAGVSHSTFFDWLARGRWFEPEGSTDHDRRCVRLLEAIRQAQVASTAVLLSTLREAARSSRRTKTTTTRRQLVDENGVLRDEVGEPLWAVTMREEVTEAPNIAAAVALLRHRRPGLRVDDFPLVRPFETDREMYRRLHGRDPETDTPQSARRTIPTLR